ncbi:helix-turn-helix transcriptional regulator [Candidatus Enterococcus clewellii]|uniref:HTH cro/C1-type domain-containing protein n=1 Tax=Candidatus Enterococcus clewellii TaxID=1834193 RepID=A0AAQ3VX23_9ENTE
MNLSKYIGNKIKYYREQRNLTQDDLSELLNTTRQSISRYETGERKANQDILFELAEIFKVKVDDFFPIRYPDEEKNTLMLNEESEPYVVSKMYNFKDDEQELLDRYRNLSKSSKDAVLRFVIDLEIQGFVSGIKTDDYLGLAKELSKSSIVSIRELAQYAVRNLEENGKVRKAIKDLLLDCKIFVDENRTNTAEFINIKRKIYETLLPLSMFSVAYDQKISIIGDFADHFRLSEEFTIEALNYYAATKGTVFEYISSLSEYIIDVSNIPLEYINEDSGNAEIIIKEKEKN